MWTSVNQMKVNFIDLNRQYNSIKEEVDKAIQEVINQNAFAAGPFVKSFENNFAKAHSCKFCIGVSSGTAALHVSLMALEISIGDEVIVPSNTFFATAEAVSLTGATPVFVDCEEQYFNINPNAIEDKITKKTKAIVAVHLYGQPAKMDTIKKIAEKYNLYLIEDCAQSHLAEYKGCSVGTFGTFGCFSFYPGKNLGAYGEGGAVLTNDETMFKKIIALRNHGMTEKYHHEYIGHNYRLEGIQGAVLDVKLKYLTSWTKKRRENANLYRQYLSDVDEIVLPDEMPDVKHVYHLFVIRTQDRDGLANFLNDSGIYTGIHYPVPCHSQNAYAFLGYKENSFPVSEKYANEILSLPMFAELMGNEILFIADKIKEYFRLKE